MIKEIIERTELDIECEELKKKIYDLKDKLHRRNALIKKLRERIKIITKDDYRDGEIYRLNQEITKLKDKLHDIKMADSKCPECGRLTQYYLDMEI